ncbi:MAG: tripartite tricarboxylate transporter substrate-binding protein [Actinomycetota bacterium]|nr:tripartite tricarboxylate transporter substrate-binding protein [Actinomycetota bacterium]
MRRTALALALGALLVTSCSGAEQGSTTAGQQSATAGSQYPTRTVRVMAPAAPGGGWDQTSRAVQEVLDPQVQPQVEVYNVPGAGGTVGLAQFVGTQGQPHELMTMGAIMVGAIETNKSPVKLDRVTPLVRLLSEHEVVVVPSNSRYQTMQQLLDDMRANLPSVSLAGGSAGGVEQVLAGLIAKQIGQDPKRVNYIAHSGGGEALTTILSGRASAGLSGIAEVQQQIQSGQLRALAVSAPQRVAGVDAPTLREAGVDVTLENWRGIVGPPQLSDGDEAAAERMLTQMARSPQWQQVLQQRGWQDTFLAGEEFDRFVASEQERYRGILRDLGLVQG